MRVYHNCEHCGNETVYESVKGARPGPRGPRVVLSEADSKERKKVYNRRYYEKKKVITDNAVPSDQVNIQSPIDCSV